MGIVNVFCVCGFKFDAVENMVIYFIRFLKFDFKKLKRLLCRSFCFHMDILCCCTKWCV